MGVFLKSIKGSIAFSFAIILMIVSLAIGVAADYANVTAVKSAAQRALDSALLAHGGRHQQMEQADLEAAILSHFNIGARRELRKSQIDVLNLTAQSESSGALTAQVALNANLLFGALVGLDAARVDVSAGVMSSGIEGPVKISIALDASTSMTSYTAALREALTTVVETLEPLGDGATLSIFPFSQYSSNPNNGFWIEDLKLGSDRAQIDKFIQDFNILTNARSAIQDEYGVQENYNIICSSDAMATVDTLFQDIAEHKTNIAILMHDADGFCSDDVQTVTACQALRDRGVTVNVAKFGSSSSTLFQDCAGGAQNVFVSETAEGMTKAFLYGSEEGKMRLVQ